jgi:hypothetical protein
MTPMLLWFETRLRREGWPCFITRDFDDSIFVPVRGLGSDAVEPRYTLIEIRVDPAAMDAVASTLVAAVTPPLIPHFPLLLDILHAEFPEVLFTLEDGLISAATSINVGTFLTARSDDALDLLSDRFLCFCQVVAETCRRIDALRTRDQLHPVPRVLREAQAIVRAMDRQP